MATPKTTTQTAAPARTAATKSPARRTRTPQSAQDAMFETPTPKEEPAADPVARGGISISSVAAGSMLAFGALFPLSALTAGVLAAIGKAPVDFSRGSPTTIGGAAFVLALAAAYFWGGYASGRMGRGAGIVNGLLVPLGTVLFAAGVVGAASAFGGRVSFNLPFSSDRLPIDHNFFSTLGAGLGVLSLIVMIGAGTAGGLVGARWHERLERRAGLEVAPPVREERPARSRGREESRSSRFDADGRAEGRSSRGEGRAARFEGGRANRFETSARSGRGRRRRIA